MHQKFSWCLLVHNVKKWQNAPTSTNFSRHQLLLLFQKWHYAPTSTNFFIKFFYCIYERFRRHPSRKRKKKNFGWKNFLGLFLGFFCSKMPKKCPNPQITYKLAPTFYAPTFYAIGGRNMHQKFSWCLLVHNVKSDIMHQQAPTSS